MRLSDKLDAIGNEVLTMEQENERLKCDIEESRTDNGFLLNEISDMNIQAAELAAKIKELSEQFQESAVVTKLLDAIRPEVERAEKLTGNGSRLQTIIEAYREIRPK